jgi:hypothetical protein
MFNPDLKYAHSKGVDLPLMYVYLAGYMAGEKLQECTSWRKEIRAYYRNWELSSQSSEGKKEYLSFPISFLDPFNGKEIDTIDKKGLTSSIPAHAIIHGDYMSVTKADVVVANLDTFGADRPMIGTHWELAWTWNMKKPFVLIVPENKLETYTKHPFTSQASWVVTSVTELLNKKVLETFYKRMAGAVYE